MKSKSLFKSVLLFLLITSVAIIPSIIQKESSLLQASEEQSEMVFADNNSLIEEMNIILEKEHLSGAIVGATVKLATSGETLYSENGDVRLHPASNMKLLTAAAALETLGEDYRFRTEVLTDGKQTGAVLHGNLYLKGKGDPTLLKSDFDEFAKELKARGIKTIEGNLVGDDTWYDDVRLSQDLNWSDEPFHTGAQVSALTLSPNEDYDSGTVIVEVTPGKTVEEKAQVHISPETDYVEVINRAKMVPSGDSKQIMIEREHGSNRIIVEGTMPIDGKLSQSWVSVWEPTGYALAVFRKSLNEQGIKFIGNSEVKFEAAPGDAQILTARESMPLSELLIPFMKLSNNGHAEVLTKEMGKIVHGEGTWEKGLEVMQDEAVELGVNRDTILLRDGSGMSHKNLIPSNELSQLLFEVQDKSWFPAFQRSLPVAGETERLVGGTLRNRITAEPAKGNVAAKTGLITGVSALSGYVTTQEGEILIFSILINNYLGSSETVQAIEDEIVMMLAGYEFRK